jgi:hypothetical protein
MPMLYTWGRIMAFIFVLLVLPPELSPTGSQACSHQEELTYEHCDLLRENLNKKGKNAYM